MSLNQGQLLNPDVLFVSEGNQAIVQDWIRGAPDLVIEVISPDNAERDRIVKRDLYARNGIKEFWLVDDDAKCVEVLVLQGSAYQAAGYFEIADSVQSQVLPDLHLAVRQIFA